MSVRALAERVLLSTTLADKLRAPEALSDDPAPFARPLPERPGRPAELRFGQSRRRAFPGGARELESDAARGVALHFFANHELLAMELMALVLLKFPNAPRRFRWGVVHTLLEEQDHLRRYADRMNALGVEMGDVPVSDFFWRCLAGMHSPLDFVAGMSLTFEQANIDFARYYAERFRDVGDLETADVLDRVLADEIRHVAHGRVWLERWGPPAETLFARHRAALPGPLTLRRARGPVFCASERRAAGLPDEYIDELRVHSDGRGRRPDLWVFNPGAEEALAGTGPSRTAEDVRHDLAPLLGFLAATDDCVLVDAIPSVEQRSALADAGLEPPRYATASEAPARVEKIRPWAATPDLVDALPSGLAPRTPFQPLPAAPFSKAWDLDVDRALPPDVAAAFSDRPGPRRLATTRSEIERLVRRHGALRLKAPLATSGRAQRVARSVGDLEAHAAWLDARLAAGGVVAEPELEVVFELSAVLDLDRTSPVRGFLEACSDPHGRYVGHRLAPPWPRLPPSLLRAFGGGAEIRRALSRVVDHVAACLRTAGGSGLAGVDTRVHRDADGTLRVQPIGEVNPRCTMGHVAAALARRSGAGRDGLHLILPRSTLGEAPPAPAFDPDSRTGFLYTTDPSRARRLVGVLSLVERGADPRGPLPAGVRTWLDRRVRLTG